MRYEYIIYNDPVKHEGTYSDPQVTEHETYCGARIEEKDTPETNPFVNEDQQVAIQAIITGVNSERRDTLNIIEIKKKMNMMKYIPTKIASKPSSLSNQQEMLYYLAKIVTY